jgi:hypothetical protein
MQFNNLSFRRLYLGFASSLVLSLFIIGLLSGCKGETPPAQTGRDRGSVLATVNGSPITQNELLQGMRASLGPHSSNVLDEAGRRKMLESLVAARAIAQVQEQALTDAQKEAVEIQTAAFREQLLVKMYLAQNVPPQPVSHQMVEQYYREHPEKFGAKTIRVYEMIASDGKLAEKDRDRVLTALQTPHKVKDWTELVQRLKKKGLPVVYRSGQADAGVLQARLRDLMQPLAPGQTSALTLIEGVVYVVRITAEKKIPAQPLNQVGARIRKMLLPIQLKKAVKQASEKVLAEAEVEYVNQ